MDKNKVKICKRTYRSDHLAKFNFMQDVGFDWGGTILRVVGRFGPPNVGVGRFPFAFIFSPSSLFFLMKVFRFYQKKKGISPKENGLL